MALYVLENYWIAGYAEGDIVGWVVTKDGLPATLIVSDDAFVDWANIPASAPPEYAGSLGGAPAGFTTVRDTAPSQWAVGG